MNKGEIENMNKEQLLDQLEDVLIGMNVPQQREKDIAWLSRNISINNAGHPNLLKAIWIIQQLKKEEENA
jgi:hypothetical protein